MGQKLSAPDKELYRRVDEVLFYRWDPIGISDLPEGRDEYYSYLGVVFSMLKHDKTASEIAAYLTGITEDRMGLVRSPESEARDREVATLIERHKHYVTAKYRSIPS